jgi:hypothetical protein
MLKILNRSKIQMAQFSSWVHGVAAQHVVTESAGIKQSGNLTDATILEFNSTDPTALNPGVLHCSKRFQGDGGCALRIYCAVPTPSIVLGARANILRVFLRYDCEPGVAIDKVLVFDGSN